MEIRVSRTVGNGYKYLYPCSSLVAAAAAAAASANPGIAVSASMLTADHLLRSTRPRH